MRYKYYSSPYLEHHGIKGQKWGVRRFQNPDGSYKNGAKGRYNEESKQKLKKVAKGVAVVAGTALLAYAGYQAYKNPQVRRFAQKGMSFLKQKTNIPFKEATRVHQNQKSVNDIINKMNKTMATASKGNPSSNTVKNVTPKSALKFSNDSSWQSAHEKIDKHYMDGLKKIHPSDVNRRKAYIDSAKKYASREHAYLKELENNKSRYANQVRRGLPLPKDNINSEKDLTELLLGTKSNNTLDNKTFDRVFDVSKYDYNKLKSSSSVNRAKQYLNNSKRISEMSINELKKMDLY